MPANGKGLEMKARRHLQRTPEQPGRLFIAAVVYSDKFKFIVYAHPMVIAAQSEEDAKRVAKEDVLQTDPTLDPKDVLVSVMDVTDKCVMYQFPEGFRWTNKVKRLDIQSQEGANAEANTFSEGLERPDAGSD